MATIEGEAGLFAGQTRYGKSTAVIEHLTDHAPCGVRRVLVWSPKEEIDDYAGKLRATTVTRSQRALVAALERAGSGDAVIVHVPNRMSEFGWWAKAAHWWAKRGGAAGRFTGIVGEELADVTSPGKAPEGWGTLIRRGLGHGACIYGVSQRPAESDKTLIGNATFVHCHYLRRKGDQKYMADEMDATIERIRTLKKYQWIQAWAGEAALREGQTRG